MRRRHFLASLPVATCGALAAGGVLGAEGAATATRAAIPAEFPRQDREAVREVVSLSHRSLEGVRRLVEPRPALAKASWDWGFGDWESALGAASHTGQREIALFLMDQGARPNIFTFAMLGHVDAVKALVEAQPGIQRSPGPHGITLLRHARAGREAARAVVEYLESLGDADIGAASAPLSEEERASILGTFVYGSAAGERFTVELKKSGLAFTPAGGVSRGLAHLGGRVFHPAGAPGVIIAFEGSKSAATSARVRDGALELVATRD